ncbi:MAG: hypothetical protein CMN32_02030 [Saprospirales bacterium]|nr:hypothetical protein [Saprospirales bacterium]
MLAAACTEPPPPTLNYKERLLVDSLYNQGVDSLRPILDSLCTLHFDSLVQASVDSMMQERLEEIERYLQRIKGDTTEQQ